MISEGSALPADLLELLDGTRLEEKIGTTLLLSAAEDDGWPHTALLSVGEVYAPSAQEVRLALYATSGTTEALTKTGRALLTAVIDGHVHKVRLTLDRLVEAATESEANVLFFGRVEHVDDDRVGYARITHGVEYELYDPEAVLERWERKVALLREMSRQED